jgi:DNA-binding XRE family transcriptional regulator
MEVSDHEGIMKRKAATNYLKTHRRRFGLTQREMGELLGYKDPGQVSRHERSKSIPSLRIALAYELIFRVPVAALFVGLHGSIRGNVENKLRQMETELHGRTAMDSDAKLVAQKLVWLNERRNRE